MSSELTDGFLDALSFTFRPEKFDLPPFCHILRHVVGDFAYSVRKGGMHGFKQSVELAGLGSIHYGGDSQRNAVLVQLLGVACARITDWPLVVRLLRQWNAKITRVDLTCDVLDGIAYNVDAAVRDYRDKKFSLGSRSPLCDCYGDWVNHRSRTFYVGAVASGKLLRVYEKGHQLKSEKYPNWVRIECQLSPKDRLIPFACILQPMPFLAGSYPALHWLNQYGQQIKTAREIAERTITQVLDVARNQAGRACHAALEYHSGDKAAAFDHLHRSQLPAKLVGFKTLAEKHLKDK